jgi:hypothetical protein
MTKHVYILTWCFDLDNLYGTTLIFKTLRVGFPKAQVHVIDNVSNPAVRPLIKQHAEECGAEFTQLEQRIPHYTFLEQTLNTQPEGTAIFIDPDICLWENVEEWNFDQLMAGRLIPKYACEYSGCLTHPRLHPSFLWIPDVCTWREKIQAVQSQYYEFYPFLPVEFKLDNIWQRFDTGGILYTALSEQVYSFTEKELDAYDHLFCGTHLEDVAPKIRPDMALWFREIHKQAQINHQSLKGAWRIQEDYFQSLAV